MRNIHYECPMCGRQIIVERGGAQRFASANMMDECRQHRKLCPLSRALQNILKSKVRGQVRVRDV